MVSLSHFDVFVHLDYFRVIWALLLELCTKKYGENFVEQLKILFRLNDSIGAYIII